jgi:hypothetical protein
MKLIQGGDRQPRNFWGEVTPSDHLVQIYEHEASFLAALQGFVVEGVRAGDGVVVIATEPHRRALDERLAVVGCDVDSLRARGQYIVLDAKETLEHFMVAGWPDELRFDATISGLLERASAGHTRPVRAFGEMVALLWAQGHCGATVRLEHLWHRICASERLALLCAYPRSGFTTDAAASIRQICDAHSHVVERNRLVPSAAASPVA